MRKRNPGKEKQDGPLCRQSTTLSHRGWKAGVTTIPRLPSGDNAPPMKSTHMSYQFEIKSSREKGGVPMASTLLGSPELK